MVRLKRMGVMQIACEMTVIMETMILIPIFTDFLLCFLFSQYLTVVSPVESHTRCATLRRDADGLGN
jgi:hypothetical protein